MSGKKTGKRQHHVKRMKNLIGAMTKAEIREAIRQHEAEQAEAKQPGGGKSQPASRGTAGQTPGAAFTAGVQGGELSPTGEPQSLAVQPGETDLDRRLRMQEMRDRLAAKGHRLPPELAGSDSSRMLTPEQVRRRREQEAARRQGPSKKERKREERYQAMRQRAGLPPSGSAGSWSGPGGGYLGG